MDTEGISARAGTEFPIYSYLLATLYGIVGIHEMIGRCLSIFFGVWGAVFLYGFVRRRLGDRVALWSMLAMCVVPVHLYFSRSVQPEAMALWGLLGYLYHLDRWLDRPDGAGDWLAAVLLGSLAPLLKLPFLYIILPLWAYLGFERHRSRELPKAPFFAMIVSILGLTSGWYRYAKTAPLIILPLTLKEHLQNLRPILSWDLYRNHFVSRFPELCATYPGVVLGIVGAYALKREGKLPFWAAWFLTTALYIVLLGEYGLIHRYTELPWAPPVAVFIAAGIVFWWDRAKGNARSKAALLVLVVGIPVHAGFRIAHWYRWEYPWVFRANAALARVSRPAELLITNTREHPVLLYYLDRYGFAPDLEETGFGALDYARSRGARIFLTPTAEGWSRHPEWASYFAKNARLLFQDPDFLIFRLS